MSDRRNELQADVRHNEKRFVDLVGTYRDRLIIDEPNVPSSEHMMMLMLGMMQTHSDMMSYMLETLDDILNHIKE